MERKTERGSKGIKGERERGGRQREGERKEIEREETQSDCESVCVCGGGGGYPAELAAFWHQIGAAYINTATTKYVLY